MKYVIQSLIFNKIKMKQYLLTLIFTTTLLCFHSAFAQQNFSFNAGAAQQEHYFTTIAYKELNGKLVMEAEINNKTYHFILDTGAATTITQKLFDELDARVLTKMAVSDQSNLVDTVTIASLDNVKLGDVTFKDTPVFVVTETLLFDCFKVDGLIGSNLLRNSILQISSKNNTITITNDPKPLKLKRKYSTKMDLNAIQSNPFIWVTFRNGNTTGRDYPLIDTGMDGFYDLSIKAYEEVFKTVNLFKVVAEATGSFTWGLHGISQQQRHYQVFAPQLEVSKNDFKNVTTTTTHGESSRIGADIFKYGLVTLDYSNKKFYFEPYEQNEVDLSEKSWPLQPSTDGEKMIVGVIWDKELATKINVGDEILQFGTIDFTTKTICDMFTSNSKQIGITTATLVTKDAITGEVKRTEVTKR
jgi:predicted aspartyl protease